MACSGSCSLCQHRGYQAGGKLLKGECPMPSSRLIFLAALRSLLLGPFWLCPMRSWQRIAASIKPLHIGVYAPSVAAAIAVPICVGGC